jgi:hypothetical protein
MAAYLPTWVLLLPQRPQRQGPASNPHNGRSKPVCHLPIVAEGECVVVTAGPQNTDAHASLAHRTQMLMPHWRS